ncbi:MAG: ester cyclase [Nitrososphaera sp.]
MDFLSSAWEAKRLSTIRVRNNKQLVRNFVQDVLTNHNIEAPDKYFVQKPIRNNEPVIGIEGFKQSRLRLFQEFPDSRTTVDHNVAECDQVFAMVTATATNKEPAKTVTIQTVDLCRIGDCKITEHWDTVDESGIA